MASDKIVLTSPIYEMQKDETPKQYWVVNEFFHYDGSIRSFAHELCSSEEDQSGKKRGPSGTVFPFKKMPAERTIRNWLLKLRATERKKAYWKNFIEETQQSLRKPILDFFKRDVNNLIDSADRDWDLDKKIDNSRKVKPHTKAKGKADLSKSHSDKVELMLTESGMPKDISKSKNEIMLEAEIDAKKENYLFVDELAEFNLDKAFEEVTECVDGKPDCIEEKRT